MGRAGSQGGGGVVDSVVTDCPEAQRGEGRVTGGGLVDSMVTDCPEAQRGQGRITVVVDLQQSISCTSVGLSTCLTYCDIYRPPRYQKYGHSVQLRIKK